MFIVMMFILMMFILMMFIVLMFILLIWLTYLRVGSGSESEHHMCMLCDNRANIMFKPCGHVSMCSECAQPRVKKCPLCKVWKRYYLESCSFSVYITSM